MHNFKCIFLKTNKRFNYLGQPKKLVSLRGLGLDKHFLACLSSGPF